MRATAAEIERRESAYKKHRHYVLHAKSLIDNTPPTFMPSRFTRIDALKDDARDYMQRTKSNIVILMELSRTMRTSGVIDTFRAAEFLKMESNNKYTIDRINKIENENFALGKRLLDTQAIVQTRQKPVLTEQEQFKRRSANFQCQQDVFKKYEGWTFSMPNSGEMYKLMRPRVYFDMYLHGVRPLGRVEIELFTEAAPQVVWEFVQTCVHRQNRQFRISRLFPSLWMVFDLKVDPRSMTSHEIEYDMRPVDHGKYKNILSFAKSFLNGFQNEVVSFAISFKKLSVANNNRIGFGRVIKGSKVLDCLQPYGTKNGKMSKEIVVTQCGLIT